MAADKDLSIREWWEQYEENPFDALDRLLCRRVFMGALHPNETDEILFRLFHNKSNKTLQRLDEVMQEWCAYYWGKTQDAMPSSRWANVLQNAFIAVYRLKMGKTALFLREKYIKEKSWIRSLYNTPARDPEGELLRTLALLQKDQTLLPLWMRLCRMEEDLPIDYTSIGLMGLRKLPEKDGSPQGDLPGAFFKGAIYLAEALGNRKKKECMDFWLREMRAIVALYPRMKDYWARYFYPFLYNRQDSIPAQWLNKVIPKIANYYKPKSVVYTQPPPRERLEHFLKLIKEHPLKKFRSDLEIFLEDHRRYAYQTGDASFLVRTFSNIGYKVLKQDASFALELVEEAFAWEPYNPFLWSQRAIIETYRGNISRAIVLLWEARRRFPENPQIRAKLAHLMEKQGKYKVAETLYRQAVEDFPGDAICRAGLADVLKAQGKFAEAEEIYRQAVDDFPGNAFCRNGLAEVLKAQGRYDESEEVYRQTMKDFQKDVVCRNGLAVVLVKQQRKNEAVTLLKETLKAFPGNKVAKGFLEKITQGKKITEEDEKALELHAAKSTYKEFPGEEDLEDDFDFPAEAAVPAILFPPASAEKTGTTMEQALEKSGVSLIRARKPDEYGAPPSPPSPGFILPEIAEIEAEAGEMALELRESRHAAAKEKEEYNRRITTISTSLENLLEKVPENLTALMLKGLLLAGHKPDEAEDFFAQKVGSHPNTLGFRLLQLRSKTMKGKAIDSSQWNDLMRDFPARSTVINLECTLCNLDGRKSANGDFRKVLERLQRQLLKDPGQLPVSLKNNEEWVRQIVRQRVFENHDINESISSALSVAIEESLKNKERESKLRDTVDQIIYSAI